MDDARSTPRLTPVRLAARGGRPSRAAAFLDRDGVLNDVRGDGHQALSPRTPEQVTIPPFVRSQVDRLRDRDLLLVVVTNQPDVARGTLDYDIALELTRRVMKTLDLDDGYICVHDSGDRCECRKPLPGMLLAAARDWDLDLRRSWLIGDRWVDVAAAVAAGVHPVLLEAQYSWHPSGGADPPPGLAAEYCGPTLASCVDFVLDNSQ